MADEYQLHELIGRGSYASVYRASKRGSGTEFAVKVLPRPHDANTSGLNALQGEIEALRRCTSDHVVSLFAAFEHDASIWLVMQYCLASVADVLRASPSGCLNESDVAAICRGTLHALIHLHELLFIHRDVKPQNILISQAFTPMLADLGVSAQLASDSSRRGTVIGSPLYLAPEMIVAGSYDQRCDIWSLGISAIEMAEGRPPLHHVNPPLRALFLIPSQPPPTLDPARATPDGRPWSDAFRGALARCLAKDPDDRPRSHELAADGWFTNAPVEVSAAVCERARTHALVLRKNAEAAAASGAPLPSLLLPEWSATTTLPRGALLPTADSGGGLVADGGPSCADGRATLLTAAATGGATLGGGATAGTIIIPWLGAARGADEGGVGVGGTGGASALTLTLAVDLSGGADGVSARDTLPLVLGSAGHALGARGEDSPLPAQRNSLSPPTPQQAWPTAAAAQAVALATERSLVAAVSALSLAGAGANGRETLNAPELADALDALADADAAAAAAAAASAVGESAGGHAAAAGDADVIGPTGTLVDRLNGSELLAAARAASAADTASAAAAAAAAGRQPARGGAGGGPPPPPPPRATPPAAARRAAAPPPSGPPLPSPLPPTAFAAARDARDARDLADSDAEADETYHSSDDSLQPPQPPQPPAGVASADAGASGGTLTEADAAAVSAAVAAAAAVQPASAADGGLVHRLSWTEQLAKAASAFSLTGSASGSSALALLKPPPTPPAPPTAAATTAADGGSALTGPATPQRSQQLQSEEDDEVFASSVSPRPVRHRARKGRRLPGGGGGGVGGGTGGGGGGGDASISSESAVVVRRACMRNHLGERATDDAVRAVLALSAAEREAVSRAAATDAAAADAHVAGVGSWCGTQAAACAALVESGTLRALAEAITEAAAAEPADGAEQLLRTPSAGGGGGGGIGVVGSSGSGGSGGSGGSLAGSGGVSTPRALSRASSDATQAELAHACRLAHATAAQLTRMLSRALDGDVGAQLPLGRMREVVVPLLRPLLMHADGDVRAAALELAYALREPLATLAADAERRAADAAAAERTTIAAFQGREPSGRRSGDDAQSPSSESPSTAADARRQPQHGRYASLGGEGALGHLSASLRGWSHNFSPNFSSPAASAQHRQAAAVAAATPAPPADWANVAATAVSPECRSTGAEISPAAVAMAAAAGMPAELAAYAEHLAIEPRAERSLLYLAEAAVWAARDALLLPAGWSRKLDATGATYYEQQQGGTGSGAPSGRARTHPHAAPLAALARLQRAEGFAASFDPRWSCAELADEVCARLAAAGLADASHALRWAERQRGVRERFANARLDGARLATLNARALEVAVRDAMGDDARMDSVLGALTAMLPPARAVDVGHRSWHGTLSSEEAREVKAHMIERERARAPPQAGGGTDGGGGSGGSSSEGKRADGRHSKGSAGFRRAR